VNMTKCVFGTLPLGNDNNLSKTLNFKDRKHASTDMTHFKQMLISYCKATEADIDIWKLELTLENDGGVFQYKEEKKTEMLDENHNNIGKLEKTFISSFSLGLDARVGYGFDKKKSNNSCFNKLLYCWESVKKLLCLKTMSLNKYIDVFLSDEKEVFRVKEEKDIAITKNLTYKYCKEKVVLKGDPMILIGQNVNYYNGSSHFWNKAKSNLGLEFEDEGIPTKIDKKNKKEEEINYFKDLCEKNQEINDEKMEFYTYGGMMGLGAEKIIGGYAKKIHQSRGPFMIKVQANDKKSCFRQRT